MSKWHLANWHPGTWLVALLWIFFSGWANYPLTVPGDREHYQRMLIHYERVTGAPAPPGVIQVVQPSGFPLQYQRERLLSSGQSSVEQFSPTAIVINVVLCGLATLFAMGLMQMVTSYSIRTLFAATALCAIALAMRPLMMAAGVSFRSSGREQLSEVLLLVVKNYFAIWFFMPCLLALLLALRHFLSGHPRDADSMPSVG